MANRLADYDPAPIPEAAYWPAGYHGEQSVQDRLNSLFEQSTEWIKQHPEIAVTAAVVTGVVLGWLIKRR